ncbi:SpoIIE family protein phosphatase [Heyndrickxia acidiproducens]|uniref:SpoIIE family protein phosphatase n=1 Tax=Heyndrickxia acidiproducens TaxID=1121084 RepID=UPI00036F0488|nr:fused response regulator/phosphatase [Heyndrickxia acidiproducens]
MTILIVDDHKVNLFVIENILKNAGFTQYLSFTSANELFNYLHLDNEHAPKVPADCILMDIMMPEIDGIEACRILQQSPRFRDIPVIFLTALDDSQKLAEALGAGGTDYITKPINKVELIARIHVAIRLKAEKDWHIEQEKKIKDELDLATQVQRTLLSAPLEENCIAITSSYKPANKLAGDLYYWHKTDDGRYAIMLLDVMGHGISASLVCMFISSKLRDLMQQKIDPEIVMPELNKLMRYLNNDGTSLQHYFTAIYLVIDCVNKTVEYVNAGHPPAFALVDNQNVTALQEGSCAVGFFPHLQVKKQVLRYTSSLQLLMFTDGVMEALDTSQTDGLKGLEQLASSPWVPEKARNPLDVILPKELQEQQPDDMCVILVQTR